jgi:D-alanyl-D-alanine dipeptidase
MDLEGRLVRMGTGFDEFSDYTPTRYYEAELERGRRLSLTAIEALQNRRVRFHVMRSCGFTNYHKEWWHFDFGNQPWAIQEDTIAKYGKASLPAAL